MCRISSKILHNWFYLYPCFILGRSIIVLVAVISLNFHPALLNGQTDVIKLDCVTLEQGLSQSTINEIVQDAQGFMWFGTIDGLNKFDGRRFKVYRSNTSDTTFLVDDWITCLYIGFDGTLWVGTLSGVLSRYEPQTDRFVHYRVALSNHDQKARQESLTDTPYIFSSFLPNTISAICQDRSGMLWIGTFGSGLYRFDQKQNQLVSVMIDTVVEQDRRSQYITSLGFVHENRTNTLWIGTFGAGLIRRDSQGQVSYFQHQSQDDCSLGDNRILSVYPDPDSIAATLWIGTLTAGLEKFDWIEKKCQHFQHDPYNKNSLSGNTVVSTLKDSHGILWIGTIGNGLNKLEVPAERIVSYYHEPMNPTSLASNDVLSLYEDRSGVIWVGTNLGNGVNKFDRRKKKFTHYFHDPLNPNSLSENVIYGIHEDQHENLYIGSFQSGLDKLDRKRQKVIHYRHDPADPSSLPDDHVRCVYVDKEDVLWIGTAYCGLAKFIKSENNFKSYKYHSPDGNDREANFVFNILEDADENLWLGTKGAGLFKFNKKSTVFTRYQNEPDNPNSIASNFICATYLDKSGILWIGTFGGGLSQFNIRTGRFRSFQKDPNNPNSLGDDRVQTILQDPADSTIFWIGTYGGGLDKLNVTQMTFKHYQEKDGLPNNVVYGILSDGCGELWLSTNKGLAKFSPASETFAAYELTDGLQSYEFNAGAYHKCRDGEMFFGGINGLNGFHPAEVHLNRTIPPVVMTSFKIFDNESVLACPNVARNRQIDLSYKDNFFTFEFAALDYVNPGKNHYAYQLEGFDKAWQYCENRTFASYTNVPPGDYTFKVKAANCDGVWNETGAFVKIKIAPPFWKTWEFYVLTIIFCLTLALMFHFHRIRIMVKRSLELERIRNAESDRVRRIVATDFHDEIGQKLTCISLFSELLKRKLKSLFSDNVEYIDKISETVKELSESTRDFIWTLNPELDSLFDVVMYLKDFGDELFVKSGIKFQVEDISDKLHATKLPMEWRRQIVFIFKNAMTQIYRQQKGNQVMFRVALAKKRFAISLSINNEKGEPNLNLPAQGWLNIKKRAERIQGRLEVISKNGSGAALRFMAETSAARSEGVSV